MIVPHVEGVEAGMEDDMGKEQEEQQEEVGGRRLRRFLFLGPRLWSPPPYSLIEDMVDLDKEGGARALSSFSSSLRRTDLWAILRH